MYRLIASDMDETFLDSHHRIPAPNLAALRRLRELGVLFVPSSGRSYHSIMANFADVDASLLEGSYVLSYNGGTCNRVGDARPLFEHALDHGLAELMWGIGVERGLCMHAYTPDGRVLVRGMGPSERSYLRGLHEIEETSMATLAELPVVSKMLFMSDDFAWLHGFAERHVRPRLGTLADLTFSSGRYLEVNPAGVNKGTGLVELARILGVDVTDTIGIGDSANDLEMIEAAGLGVGVANVSDDVRPSCDLVLGTAGVDGALPELVSRVIEPQHAAPRP